MRYKVLGRTGVKIPCIGMGCMGIGGGLDRNDAADADHIDALKMGIDYGMTFLDTAEVYGKGHSEELVGRAIKGMRDKVFVASKVSPEHLSRGDVIVSAEGSLKRLGIDCIDLYQVHWPNPTVPVAETMAGLETLVEQGKIRFIGLSNFSLRELKEAQAHLSRNVLASLQVEYNLFDRMVEEAILPYCEDHGITSIAYSPLDQGRLADHPGKAAKLTMLAEKRGKTAAQIILNWLVTHPSVVAIPKALKPAHIKENAEAADFALTAADRAEIEGIFSQGYVRIPCDRISVIDGGHGNRRVYVTVEDALENKLGFVPSPAQLAEDIRNGDMLKPVRVAPAKDTSGRSQYDLLEGRIRYWAWVIAFDGKEPVPVYIRYECV